MPGTLKSKRKEKIALLNVDIPEYIAYSENKNTVFLYSDGSEKAASCINCDKQYCRRVDVEEIECEAFPNMSHHMNLDTCPTEAITSGENAVLIDKDRCIGCGICVARCPIGALHISEGKATHNSDATIPTITNKRSEESLARQQQYLTEIRDIKKKGAVRNESDSTIRKLQDEIEHLSQVNQNLLARNILISSGVSATVSRHGNVYLRMDGFYESDNTFGIMEIETGADMLDVSRAILDDIVTLNARYGIKKEENKPLAIVLSLPNRRTDYWQVVKDIKDITGIEISTITYVGLLLLLWNHIVIQDYSNYYIDIDNSSIREEMVRLLGRKINISEGYFGALENSK